MGAIRILIARGCTDHPAKFINVKNGDAYADFFISIIFEAMQLQNARNSHRNIKMGHLVHGRERVG